MNLMEAKDDALSYLKISNTEVMKWFRTSLSVETKSDQSPVTIADRKVEELLRKKISKDYPNHGIIGEEFGEDSSKEVCWSIVLPPNIIQSFLNKYPMSFKLRSSSKYRIPKLVDKS